jgi:hypothetical protein
MKWKDWNWLNNGVLPLALAVMRVCSLWLWLVILRLILLPTYRGPLLPATLMLAVLLGSMVITGQIARWVQPLVRARVLVAVLGMTAVFLLLWAQLYRASFAWWDVAWLQTWGHEMLFWQNELPPAYLVLYGLIYLWLRGIVDSSRRLEHGHVLAALFSGCLSLVFFFLVMNLEKQPLPASISGLIFLFFAMAMMALALSSLNKGRTHETLMPQGIARPRLNRYWVSSVLVVIGVLLAVGLAATAVIAPATLSQVLLGLGDFVTDAVIFVVKVISLILYPILLLLSWLIRPLVRLIFDRNPEIASPPEPSANEPILRENLPLLDPMATPVPDELRWVLLILGILAIALVFALILRRLHAEEASIEETREFIFSQDLLRTQLGHLWQGWRQTAVAHLPPFLSLTHELDTRQTIRQIYQQLLARAGEQGWPRPQDATPVEYGRELADVFEATAVHQLTEHYQQARYGQTAPTAAQVEEVKQAWQALTQQERE